MFESYGGVQYYLDDFARLAASLHGPQNVTAVLPLDPSGRVPNVPYSVEPVRRSRNRLVAKLENRFPLRLLGRATRVARRRPPDWIVVGHVALAPLGYCLSRLTGIPWCVIAYGVEVWGDLFPQDDWCLRRASRVISISRWTAAILERNGVPPYRLRVIPPRIEPVLERDAPRPSPAGPFRLLTVSRLDATERYKGQDHALEALALLRARSPRLDWRYRIVGEGSDRPRLETLCRRLGVQDRVEFLPPVRDRADLAELYRECDLYVMPSRFGRWEGAWRGEGFGIVYAEAGACGVPSLAYRCGGALDIVEHGVSGLLVEPDDTEALSRAIEELAQDRARVAAMGREARRIVMERFSTTPVRETLRLALAPA